MSRILLPLLIITLIITNILAQNKNKISEKHRSLVPHPLYNSTTKNIADLKLHSKLLQTVYSDSFSKNYYYTTLYVGHNKVRQTYIIDTASSIMASPCSPCSECGSHKTPFYYDKNRHHKPLKCSSKICKLTPNTDCIKKKKLISSGTCSFNIKRENGDGITGYYMRDIVYFEIDRKSDNLNLPRKIYRSYALPIGCTTAELGQYKELKTDGIMGMSKNPKSFINLLYNLKIVNSKVFSLCFGLRGGYMSLGEIDKTFHKSEDIEYVPLLKSDEYYLIKLNSIKVGNITNKNIVKTPVISRIDTGNTISYFPSTIFKSLTKQFKDFCDKNGGKCGNFTYDDNYGYCAEFSNRESLFKVIYDYWPNITLYFGESEYIWKPINYYYYDYQYSLQKRKACLGFNYHSSENIILGANFIHGYDIIFDITGQRLGFVPADCSRENLIWNRWQGILGNAFPKFETTDPILMDKELHHSEEENKFHLGDNNRDEMVDFIQGHNTELDRKGISTINYIILITSICIVVVIIIIVLFVLLCSNKRLTYELKENVYTTDDTPNEINMSDDNPESNSNPDKISNEEQKNPPETNLEDEKK